MTCFRTPFQEETELLSVLRFPFRVRTPATSFPFPKPVERAAGRVPRLNGGESYQTKVTFSALVSGEEVESAEGAIRRLQRANPQVQITPMDAD